MKAIVFTKYGSPDVLELRDIEKPTPRDNEVLVKVHAAAANAGDWHLLRGEPFPVRLMFGLFKPKYQVLGVDVAGQVEAVGRSVTRFKPGDEVFGDLSESGFGAFAEYVAVPENALALKPAQMTFEEAAAVASAATTALQGLRDQGKIQAGEKVLVNGASGGVGTFAIQIAKSFGAEVTGVCSTRNIEMVRSIGADHVIDYTQDDVTQGDQRYDLILDAAAYRSLSEYRRILAPRGRYILVGGSGYRFLEIMVKGRWLSKQEGQRFGTFVKQPRQADLAFLKELLETGKMVPVIDRQYPLEETADAIRYLEEGHTQGKTVISVNGHGTD